MPVTGEDPIETREWLEAFEAVVQVSGETRGCQLLVELETQARNCGILAAPRRRIQPIAIRFP